MGQATIFAGQKIKTLKSTLNLNGGADIISSTVDPTSVATSAEPGSLLLNTTSGKLYRKNDSGSSTNWSEVGSGGSGINYISNPSAATNTTGWATYADAAGAQPVDGTGGSANVTWTRSTTTPLRGSADFNFAKDAANRQGQGVSTDFTIDLADQAKVLTVTFDYEVLSGTYADGDLTVYLIADPAGTPVVIQPAGYVVQNVTVGTKMKQIATFQTQATGQSYRLCFHVASVSASAYTLAIDNVVVGPQVVQYGAPVTDWVSYSVNWTASTTNPVIGNGALSGQYARVGQNLKAEFAFKAGSTTTFGSGTWFFSIPSGLSIDASKILLTDPASLYLGTGEIRDITGNVYTINAVYQDATKVALLPDNAGANVQSSIPFTWATGDTLSVRIEVPISGWSSTVQMSNDTDTRVVALGVVSNGTQSIPAGSTTVVYGSVERDTHSSYSSGVWTCPVSGFYDFAAGVSFFETENWTLGNDIEVAVYKNDTTLVRRSRERLRITVAGDRLKDISVKGLVYLNAGENLRVKALHQEATNRTISNNLGTYFNLERVTGPSAIAASETVLARYRTAAGDVLNTGVVSTINFLTKDYDSHAAVAVGVGAWSPAAGGNATSNWRFTAPISGVYHVTSSLLLNDNPTSFNGGTEYFSIELFKGGSLNAYLQRRRPHVGEIYASVAGTSSIRLLAGEYIEIRASQTSGVNIGLATDSEFQYVCIERVGNY